VSEDIKPFSNNDNLIGDNENDDTSQAPLGKETKEVIPNLEQNRYECRSCGYIYDPSEGNKKLSIAQNTSFELLDINTFRCPVCRAGKVFLRYGPKSKPKWIEENLVYGFGFNSLPAGQKNILIFGGLAFAAACFLSLYSLH